MIFISRIYYNLFVRLYYLFALLASPFNLKAKQWINGRKDCFSIINDKKCGGEYIWFHCASLGEFEQGRPLIEKIKAKHPKYKILLTFFSPSGYEIRKNYAQADIIVYLPNDTSANANRLLSSLNIKLAIFVKYEFWYNHLKVLHTHKIPTVLISAIFRKNQVFFKWYGVMFKELLGWYQNIYVQDEESKQLLESIDVQSTVNGDTRFDRVKDIANTNKPLPKIDTFCKSEKVIVCGSTWAKDEELLLPIINSSDYQFIIAPHQIEENRINKLMASINGKCIRYSELQESDTNDYQVLIIDNIGMLAFIYRYARIAYIGGGFGVSVHNVLEAAVYNIPTLFGPNHKKAKEAIDLQQNGGAKCVNSTKDIKQSIEFYEDESNYSNTKAAIESYIDGNLGSSDKIMKELGLK